LLLIGFVDYDERGLARETAPAAPAPGATGCYEDVSKSSNCFLLFFINDFYPSDWEGDNEGCSETNDLDSFMLTYSINCSIF